MKSRRFLQASVERWLLPGLTPFPQVKSPIRNMISLAKTTRSSSVHKAPQTQIKAVALHIQYFWESGNLKDQFRKSKNQYEKANSKITHRHRGDIGIAPLVVQDLNTCSDIEPWCKTPFLLVWHLASLSRVLEWQDASLLFSASLQGGWCQLLLLLQTPGPCHVQSLYSQGWQNTIRINTCFQQLRHSAHHTQCLSRSLCLTLLVPLMRLG